ncbi:MAG: Crp/Fnr family transcriptional regulator [Halioglobus sp.]
MSDISNMISRCSWFEGIPREGLEQLIAAASIKRWPVGSCLHTTGETTRSVFGVSSGRVRLSMSSALGHEFTIIDLESGAWTGHQCLIGDQPRMLTAQVIESAEILSISRPVLLDIGEQYPVLYRNLFHTEIHNSRRFYELTGGMLFYPLRVRLAGRLLDLLEENGQVMDTGVMLETRLSQNDFAHLAMGSRQRVNKIFREWNERGILSMEGDNYLVTDIENLRLELEIEEE